MKFFLQPQHLFFILFFVFLQVIFWEEREREREVAMHAILRMLNQTETEQNACQSCARAANPEIHINMLLLHHTNTTNTLSFLAENHFGGAKFQLFEISICFWRKPPE